MQKWEYTTLTQSWRCTSALDLKDLNAMGEAGWELVAIRYGPKGGIFDAVFKRPVGEPVLPADPEPQTSDMCICGHDEAKHAYGGPCLAGSGCCSCMEFRRK